ncbi:MAG TPA: DegT/DnrJ/EryC1/StrS aminotransferase family protein [Gammaproteobacteria bacterium]|nr:DegT/DnrJ/EryC1/StrS aminotransferase family protein [Gammaproteobacteria bacterium]
MSFKQAQIPETHYPRAVIPLKPTWSLLALLPTDRAGLPSILDARYVRKVTSGRVAIAQALLDSNIQPGDKVLLPAYHCTSMVEPVVWASAEPVFYKLQKDALIDLKDIRSKLDDKTKVLIVTHYFGFHQDIIAIRQFCDEHKLVLLEDCAHGFFGRIEGQAIGSFGDYAIASTMKFFPIFDGGILASRKAAIKKFKLSSAGWKFQLKAAFNILEYALGYGRMRLIKWLLALPLYLKDRLWQRIKQTRSEDGNKDIGPGASEGDYEFDPHWLNTSMSLPSRIGMVLCSKNRIITKRRRHYQQLHQAWSGLKGCKPLFDTLPENVVPYVYPLLIDEPESVFPILKNQGVPILRFGEYLWEGVDENTCAVTADFSKRVFQFPCHQELKQKELQWMINTVSKAISDSR